MVFTFDYQKNIFRMETLKAIVWICEVCKSLDYGTIQNSKTWNEHLKT